jgi:sterol 24-C-methyltransferase
MSLGTFKRTTVGRAVTKRLVRVLETLRIAPKGSTAVSDFLNAGATALVKGGKTGVFTPMFFFHVRKPHANKA